MYFLYSLTADIILFNVIPQYNEKAKNKTKNKIYKKTKQSCKQKENQLKKRIRKRANYWKIILNI